MFPYQGAFSQFISIIKYFELLIEKASISILFQLPQLLWLCISLIRSTFVPIVYNGLHLLSAYLTRVIPLLSGSEQFREIIMNSIPLFAIETQYLTDNENQTENEKIRNIFNWGNKYPVFVGIRYFVFPSLFHKLTEKLARDILIQMSLLPQSCNPIIDPYSVVDNKGSFTILCCSILPFLCNAIDNFSEVVSFLQSPFYSQQTNEKANYFSDQRHNLLYNQQFTDITNNEVRQDSQFSEQKQPNNQPYLFKNRADPLLQRSFSSNTSLHELNYRKVKNLVQQSSPSLSASYTFAQKSSLKQSGIIRETEFRSNYISSLPANYLFNLFNYQTNIINDEEQIVNDELPAQTLRQQVESTLIEARETAQLLALGALNQQQGTLALILQLYSRAHFNNSSEFLEAIAPSICEELDSSEIVSFELDNIPVFEQRKQGVSMIVYTLWMRQLYGASEYSTVRSIYNIIFAFLIHKEQQALRLSHVVYQILDERKWEMIREENQMMNQEDVIEREQDSNDNQNPSPATHHSPFQQQIQTQLQKQGINRISQKLLQPQNKKQLTEAQKQGNQQNKQQVSVVSDVFSASVGSASTSSSYALQSQVINQLKNASTSIQPQQNTYDSQLHGNQTLRAPKISSLFPELQPKTPNSAQSSPGQNYQSLAQLGTSPNLSVFEKDVAKIGDSNQLEPKLGLLLTTSLRANMQTPIRLYAARLFSASVRATSSFMKKDINSKTWLGLTPDNLPYQLTDVTSEKSTMEKLFIIQKAVKQMCICEMDPSISIAFGIKALTDIVGDIIVEVFKQYGKRNQKSKTVQSENRKQQITRKSEKYKKNTLQSFIWTDQTYAEWFLRFISQYSFLESNIIDETKMHDCRTTGTYEKKHSILKGNTLSLEIKLEDEWNRQLEQLWAKFDSLANLNLQEADKIWREAIDLREFAEYQIVNNLVQTLR
ncbi:MAG: hypothetical protein EZS28_002689 [Streblomastix strix]|uniref:Uncharacterized protein n=1 Tax=Streblomastix strix TaxID=222440 RepID=A0A5J4X3D9_9EUKA|nr:MAG: hypothetical protein EZS28_002689 [Streblomastix strix]